MRSVPFVALLALVLGCSLLGAGSAQAREVLLDTQALRVENVSGQSVMHFAAFRAETEAYVLTGVSGRFQQKDELLEAFGTEQEPATLSKMPAAGGSAGEEGAASGEGESDGPMSVTATKVIRIDFREERLYAEGNVRYTSAQTRAASDLLMIDNRDAVHAAVAELIAEMAPGEPRTLVEAFFAGLAPQARLILLRGNVRLQREDSEMYAAWMLLEDADEENFISVAGPGQPLQLKVQLEDDSSE